MQRRVPLLFTATLLLAGAPALAQQTDAEWLENCREQRGSSRSGRSVTHCEVRPLQMSAQGRSLTVEGGPNGGVSVHGSERNEIRISARVQARASSEAEAEALAREIRVHAADGRVSAQGPSRREGTSWAVSYEILVPRRMDLNAQTSNGPIAVSDLTGRMQLRTVNGPLTLKRVGGAVNARASNGPLVVELEGERWEGEGLDAETTNGPATLLLPERYSAELEVGTVNGPVSLEIPLSQGFRSGRRIRTTLGSGGAPLRVVTTNGPLEVRRDER
jgi:DUF4097 and DUF4098 domain-containing protein YvlB